MAKLLPSLAKVGQPKLSCQSWAPYRAYPFSPFSVSGRNERAALSLHPPSPQSSAPPAPSLHRAVVAIDLHRPRRCRRPPPPAPLLPADRLPRCRLPFSNVGHAAALQTAAPPRLTPALPSPAAAAIRRGRSAAAGSAVWSSGCRLRLRLDQCPPLSPCSRLPFSLPHL